MIHTRSIRGALALAGIACLALLVLLVGGEKSRAASSKPNIIMFTTDDQTVRDLVAMPKTMALIGNQGSNFPHADSSLYSLEAQQLQVLLYNGLPDRAQFAEVWRQIELPSSTQAAVASLPTPDS